MGKGHVVSKLPRVSMQGDQMVVPIIHSNQRQMRALKRLLDGGVFHVKALSTPEYMTEGSYFLLAKLKRARNSEGSSPTTGSSK